MGGYLFLFCAETNNNLPKQRCPYFFFFGITHRCPHSFYYSLRLTLFEPGRAHRGQLSQRHFFHSHGFRTRNLMVKGCKSLPFAPTSVGKVSLSKSQRSKLLLSHVSAFPNYYHYPNFPKKRIFLKLTKDKLNCFLIQFGKNEDQSSRNRKHGSKDFDLNQETATHANLDLSGLRCTHVEQDKSLLLEISSLNHFLFFFSCHIPTINTNCQI